MDELIAKTAFRLPQKTDLVGGNEKTPCVVRPAEYDCLDLAEYQFEIGRRVLEKIVGPSQVKPDDEPIADVFLPERFERLLLGFRTIA
jgi:hypothetical protein